MYLTASMKHRAITLGALALGAALSLTTSTVQAQEIGTRRRFGLGVVVGYPELGLDMNLYLTRSISLQIDPTIRNFKGDLYFGGRVDLLFWMPTIARLRFADLRWYFGPGARIFAGKHGFGPGFEFPVGIGFQFHRVPIELMLEAVPQFDFYDYGFEAWVAGAFHARWYF